MEQQLPGGTIGLKHSRVGELNYSAKHQHVVVIQTPTRIYFLAAATQEAQQSWIKAFLNLKHLSVSLFDPPTELIVSSEAATKNKKKVTFGKVSSCVTCKQRTIAKQSGYACLVCETHVHPQCVMRAPANCLSVKVIGTGDSSSSIPDQNRKPKTAVDRSNIPQSATMRAEHQKEQTHRSNAMKAEATSPREEESKSSRKKNTFQRGAGNFNGALAEGGGDYSIASVKSASTPTLPSFEQIKASAPSSEPTSIAGGNRARRISIVLKPSASSPNLAKKEGAKAEKSSRSKKSQSARKRSVNKNGPPPPPPTGLPPPVPAGPKSPRSRANANIPEPAPVVSSTPSTRYRPRVSAVPLPQLTALPPIRLPTPMAPTPKPTNTAANKSTASAPAPLRTRARSRSQPDPVPAALLEAARAAKAASPPQSPSPSPRSEGGSDDGDTDSSSESDDVDQDEADDVREFLEGFGIETDGVDRLAVRATILIRQLEGSGADVNRVRQSIMMKSNTNRGEPQPMDFEQLEALLTEEITSMDAKPAQYASI